MTLIINILHALVHHSTLWFTYYFKIGIYKKYNYNDIKGSLENTAKKKSIIQKPLSYYMLFPSLSKNCAFYCDPYFHLLPHQHFQIIPHNLWWAFKELHNIPFSDQNAAKTTTFQTSGLELDNCSTTVNLLCFLLCKIWVTIYITFRLFKHQKL